MIKFVDSAGLSRFLYNCKNLFQALKYKVTSWTSTPSDTNYPSEKLVKDSLDLKQATLVSGSNIKTINAESILGSGDITVYYPGTYIGTGTGWGAGTTSGYLRDNYFKNGTPSKAGDLVYSTSTGCLHKILTIHFDANQNCYYADSVYYVATFERTSRLVTAITSASTDNQYPSAKSVYDLVKQDLSDMAAPKDKDGYIKNKVGGFKVLVDNDDIDLNLSGTHTALDDFDFTFTQLTTAGCPQYAIDIMKYEPVTIWFYDSNESKVAEGETLYADDVEENGVSIVLHSDTTFTYASAVILNLANTSTYEGGNEIYYHIIKLPYNYLDVTDNITDGDYHPVTSNAVYDALSGLTADVEVKSNKVTSISSSSTDTQYPSAKCTYDSINPAIGTSQGTGMIPNKLYNLGTLTGSVTFVLAAPTDNNIANHYYWTFDTSSTAPTITWPAGISWNGGSAPTINASKHYEISIMNNIGVFMEV